MRKIPALLADTANRALSPPPTGSTQEELAGLDARALWCAAGAWLAATALVGLDVPSTALVACAGSALLVALAWVLLRNRGLLAWSHPLWAPLALFVAGGTLAAVSVAGHGLSTTDPVFDAHLADGDSLRFSVRLLEDPRAVANPDRFGASDENERDDGTGRTGKPRVTTLIASAALERYALAGQWRGTNTEVVVAVSPDHVGGRPLRNGDVVEGLGRASPASPESRETLWIRPTGPISIRGVDDAPGPAHTLRSRFLDLTRVLPADGAALLPGMVMGDRSGQDEGLSAAMKASGLVHLTAVSGANCAMVLGAVLWLARATGLGRAAAYAGSLACLVGFVVLVRPEPSVVRSAVMGAVAATAVYAGRGRQAFSSLCVCVVALLVWNPWYAGEPAFQLSVLATTGIVVLGRPLAAVLMRIMPGWLANGSAICISAQLFCLPVLVDLSAELPVYAVAANIIVAPLVPIVTVVGTSALLLAALPAPWVLPLVWASGLPSVLVAGVGRAVASLPAATVPWPEGGSGQLAAAVLAALAVSSAWLATVRRRSVDQPTDPAPEVPGARRFPGTRIGARGWAIGAAIGFIALLAGITLPATAVFPTKSGPWEVAVCDIGQGDALALRTGDRSAVVVDTGLDPGAVDACLSGLGVDTVDALFVTHLHADHAGGIAGVFRGRSVGELYYSGADPDESPRGMPDAHQARRIGAGEKGRERTLEWSAISPSAGAVSTSENDASLVVLFTLSTGATLLATGDIEEDAMLRLLGERPRLRADILKVSHHGARNGGTDVIERVGARIALISVGADNGYGHPAPEILAALDAAGMATFRTDLNGTILLRTTGRGTVELVGTPTGEATGRSRWRG
ncbi:ComEC/Rec2 family competence protein [Arthrobacter sp. KK5.5]|uniref:ComEC/Rec2 family competence protein n=1 Tax=Arthrobacter sp. KK5.5 TaxID=3373084 RepID=UPI003EE80024